MIVWWWPWQQYRAVGNSRYLKRHTIGITSQIWCDYMISHIHVWYNKNSKNMAPTSYFLRKPKIRGRICANSKYVLKFDLGLGCIKYPDDKTPKLKVDLMDGMGWLYICRCPSSKRIIYILYTLPGWQNPRTQVVARSNRIYVCMTERSTRPSDCPQ